MNKWRLSTWGDEITLEYGKALRSYEEGFFRVFGTNGPIGWTDTPLSDGPGVVLGRKGAYRGVHYSQEPFFVIDTAYYVVPKNSLDMRWIYYAMIHYQLGQIDDGSPIPSTTRAAVYPRELNVPNLEEQKNISSVLSSMDEKINCNTKTAKSIEWMARTIFHSWFIDFEPVKAKVAGATSFPLMPQAIFDALPEVFEESRIGLVPEEWAVKPITELIEINPSRSLRKNEVAPHLDMKNMPTDGHYPDKLIMRPFGSGAKFSNGDTLVARITPCLENGKTAFVNFLNQGQVAWGSTEYIVMRPHEPIPAIFAYLLARTDEFRQFAIQSMTGTSGRQRVPFSALSHFLIAEPPNDVLEAFGDLVNPMVERSTASYVESRKLAEIRDYLLPRLFSGELRVATESVE